MALHISAIKPFYTSIITTGDKFTEDMYEGSIITAKKGDLKLWQTVVAVGSSVREVKPGDKVMINADHFAVRKFSKDSLNNDLDNNPIKAYRFNWVTMEDEKGKEQNYLMMNENDLLYSFTGEERNEVIKTSSGKLIV